MTTGTERKEQRKARHKARRRKWYGRLWILVLLCVAGVVLVGLAGVYFIDKRLDDLPHVDTQYLETYETSKIYDKDGDVIWQPTDRHIQPMEYDEIPDMYQDLLVAIEDDEFWESDGYSPKGLTNMVTSTIKNKIDGETVARGGSTIDQQLIKNKYFDGGEGHEVTTRKIQELFFARQLNDNFSKEDIMKFYVNDLEFVEGARGTKAIMDLYFKKSPEDYEERSTENIAELAYLAGLSKAPSSYDLYEHEDEAHERMQLTLKAALDDGSISKKEYDEAVDYDLTENLQKKGWRSKEIHKKNMEYHVYTDGVRDEIQDMGYDINDVSLQIHTFFDPKKFEQITEKVRQDQYYLDGDQQMAATVMDSDGIVVGMVGGREKGEEEDDDWVNRATQESRSTASSTKPLLAYAPLLQYFGGKYDTSTKFDTSDYHYPGTNSTMKNYGGGTYGKETMQKSLRKSYNTPVARIMDDTLGSSRVKEFLHGIDMDVQDDYSANDGLGIHASTLQVAAAFNSLNNLGEYIEPRFVDSIEFSNGEEKDIEPEKHQAMNESVAWTVNHMLRGVPSDKGTAPDAEIKDYKGYAGKTGTNGFDDSVNPPAPYGVGSSDVWFNSITNDGYAISIWGGYDEPNTSPQIPDSHTGQQKLSKELQLMLNGDDDVKNWKKPSGVKKVSGKGIDAKYAVTDSQDTDLELPSWTELDDYNKLNINNLKMENLIDTDWEEDENSYWFDYYKDGKPLQPDVVDPEEYKLMRGDDE